MTPAAGAVTQEPGFNNAGAAEVRALGLMSGTSLDGVDIAVIDTDGERIEGFGPAATYPHAESTRERVRAVFGATTRSPATEAADAAITSAHIEAVHRFAGEQGVDEHADGLVDAEVQAGAEAADRDPGLFAAFLDHQNGT